MFLTVLEAGGPRSEPGTVWFRGALCGAGRRPPCPRALTWPRDRKTLKPSSSPKTLTSRRNPSLVTSSKPGHPPEAPPPNPVILRAGLPDTCIFRDIDTQPGRVATPRCCSSPRLVLRPLQGPQRSADSSGHGMSRLALSSESLPGLPGRCQDSGHSGRITHVPHVLDSAFLLGTKSVFNVCESVSVLQMSSICIPF